MASPVPQPARLRILKGNGVDRRPDGGKVLPQPVDVKFLPDAPSHLPEVARLQWDHVAAGLRRMEIAGPVDMAVLEAFCMAYALMREAHDRVAAEGMTATGSMGQPVAHPMLAVAAKARGQIGTLGAQLGLTPAARLRMTVPEAKSDGEEEEAFLGRSAPR